jgi:hypothetical protein
MNGELKSGMQCAEFEALLAEALDGLISGPKLEQFGVHREQCGNCGPLYAEAEAGLRWLKALDEVEPPANLMRSVLAETTGVVEVEATARPSWKTRLREWAAPILGPAWATVRQPRFVMSFGMAFFSITMVLNLTGLKVQNLRYLDLRPSALVRTYYDTQAKLVKYYDNLRFVYEVESRVRELKQAATPEENPQPKKQKKSDDNTSGDPEKKHNQNYGREAGRVVLARSEKLGPMDPPVGRES